NVAGGRGPKGVDGALEVAVGPRVSRLFEFPYVLRQAGDGRGRIEDNLRPRQPEQSSALRKVAIVANIDADPGVSSIEGRVAEIAGLEIVLLPESLYLGDVIFAVLADVPPICIDHCRGVLLYAA